MTAQKKRVTAVVLAAGQSKRMGQAKLLLPWGPHTILDTTLTHIKQTQVNKILLVSGGYQAQVEAIATAHAIPFVHNPNFATGEMISSLQTAVRYLQTNNQSPDGILVMLGDLPFITPNIMNQVITRFTGDTAVVAPVHNGRRGHPMLLSHELFTPLLTLTQGIAPRHLLQQYKQRTLSVKIDSDVILRDIDTPEEYQQWKNRKHKV